MQIFMQINLHANYGRGLQTNKQTLARKKTHTSLQVNKCQEEVVEVVEAKEAAAEAVEAKAEVEGEEEEEEEAAV